MSRPATKEDLDREISRMTWHLLMWMASLFILAGAILFAVNRHNGRITVAPCAAALEHSPGPCETDS